MEMIMVTGRPDPSSDPMLNALRLIWCGDCRDHVLFEPLGATRPDTPNEWACTACGAAYVDGFDVVVAEATVPSRGVA